MNDRRQRELTESIQSTMPLQEIVALLRQFKEQGISQAEVYSFLEAFHQSAPDEGTDDRILEVADFVAGFCAAHMKVWNSEE